MDGAAGKFWTLLVHWLMHCQEMLRAQLLAQHSPEAAPARERLIDQQGTTHSTASPMHNCESQVPLP